MQLKYILMLILVLLQQCVAQIANDQVTDNIPNGAIADVLQKIYKISENTFANASYEDKLEMLRKVEKKLSQEAKTLGKKGQTYVKLIMKGIKARVFEDINSKATKDTQVEIPSNVDSNVPEFEENNKIFDDKLLMKVAFESFNENKLSNDNQIVNNVEKTKNNDENIHVDAMESQLRHMDTNSSVINNVADNNNLHINQESTTERFIQSFTPSYECDGTLDRICMNINHMRLLKCRFDDTEVPIAKLCDGSVDCVDRTDEKFCTSQVTERVHNAIEIISEVEQSFALGCFPNHTKQSIMTSQVITFRSILEAHEAFVEKYKYLNSSLLPNSEFHKGEDTVKKTVNEVSLIVNALALGLDASLCFKHAITEDLLNARKFNDLLNDDLEMDEVLKDLDWPPKSCNCIRGRCKNITCPDNCKRVCYQKYILTRWGCESINETDNVPLNVLCDGKFDCLDQSDEKDCVTVTSFAKFEAHKLFKNILVLLSGKITSNEYSQIRSLLLTLHNSIEELQKSCTTSKPDRNIISKLRNKCFSAMSSVYLGAVAKSSLPKEVDEIYFFLLSLNEEIVNALKRSNSGNARIISKITCFCKNEECSMPVCSRKCIRSCIAEPKITRYYCEKSNKSISLDNICNGVPNCPKGEDEINCKKDICRRHHLSLLHHGLDRIGKKQEGTAMGELLSTWKTKVTSTIVIAESKNRPTHATMKAVVKDMLSDLVDTYGALEDYRRNNEYALDEFVNIARHIMDYLRSCNN